MNRFELIIFSMFEPTIILFGIFGNIMGLIILFTRKLTNLGPVHIYIFLLSLDLIYLFKILIDYIIYNSFQVDLSTLSRISCKMTFFVNYSLDVGSPMLLVYISIEKYISIRYPSKRIVLRRKGNQSAYFLLITIFNLFLYLPVYFNSDTLSFVYPNDATTNTTFVSNRTICTFVDSSFLAKLSYIDLLNRVLIPFVLMVTCSCLLIKTIFRSRRRVIQSFLDDEIRARTFKRDLKFSISSILLNIIYLFLNLPRSLFTLFLTQNQPGLFFTIYFFYLSFAANFYLVLVSNSLFRKEFVLFLKDLFKYFKIR